MKYSNIFCFVFLLSVMEFAVAGEAGHHGVHVPMSTIFWQVFNLSIVISAIIYFVRPTIIQFFASRSDAYHAEAKKAQAAKAEAEKQFLDIKHKLEHLETTKDESIARAEAEAADLRKNLIKEAEEISVKIQKDAEENIRMQLSRVKRDLQNNFIQQAVTSARQILQKDISANDHQALQASFVKEVSGSHT